MQSIRGKALQRVLKTGSRGIQREIIYILPNQKNILQKQFYILPIFCRCVETTSTNGEVYGFDALRGTQGNKEFYVSMCRLKTIPKLFIFNEYDLPPNMRAQRVLRKSRIPEIKNYILNNPEEYLFSSLTASVDGPMKFIPAAHLGPKGKMGRLYISMDSRILINDGQHRRKAIEEALKERPALGHQSISVVFFADNGLKRSQQMFSDLNKNAVKPSKSLNILYDIRDPYSRFVTEMIDEVDIFKGRVELEKTTIGKHSKAVFTLGGISDATKKLIGRPKIVRPKTVEKELALEFWGHLSKIIPEWQLVIKGKRSAEDLRVNYVHSHTNCLNALGMAGNVVVQERPDKWRRALSALRSIDWSRDNPEWSGNLIQGKHMVRTTTGIILCANALLTKCRIPIPKRMQEVER